MGNNSNVIMGQTDKIQDGIIYLEVKKIKQDYKNGKVTCTTEPVIYPYIYTDTIADIDKFKNVIKAYFDLIENKPDFSELNCGECLYEYTYTSPYYNIFTLYGLK